jgi:hypothetical protein
LNKWNLKLGTECSIRRATNLSKIFASWEIKLPSGLTTGQISACFHSCGNSFNALVYISTKINLTELEFHRCPRIETLMLLGPQVDWSDGLKMACLTSQAAMVGNAGGLSIKYCSSLSLCCWLISEISFEISLNWFANSSAFL